MVRLENHSCSMERSGKGKGGAPGIVPGGEDSTRDPGSNLEKWPCKNLPTASGCKFYTAPTESLSGTRLGSEHVGPPVWAGVRIAFGRL